MHKLSKNDPQNQESDVEPTEFARKLLTSQLTPNQCGSRRKASEMRFLRLSAGRLAQNSSTLTTADLRLAFQVTDELFFEGMVRRLLAKTQSPLSFRLGYRLTQAGGKTTCRTWANHHRHFEIAVAPRLLAATFATQSSVMVTGLRCETPQAALLRIMEHEMLHLIEMVLWRRSTCQQPRFRRLARNWFGHLSSDHHLLTPQRHAARQHQIHIGSRVCFEFANRSWSGVVNHIERRATVLVRDPRGTRFSDGQRYRKFYVPLHELRLG